MAVDVETGAVVDVSLEGVDEDAPPPSPIGLFFRRLFTFDPVKEAEIDLEAAARFEHAAQAACSAGDSERCEKLLNRAHRAVERLDARKEKFAARMASGDATVRERATRLARNLANHQVRREQVLERIEEKLTGEQF